MGSDGGESEEKDFEDDSTDRPENQAEGTSKGESCKDSYDGFKAILRDIPVMIPRKTSKTIPFLNCVRRWSKHRSEEEGERAGGEETGGGAEGREALYLERRLFSVPTQSISRLHYLSSFIASRRSSQARKGKGSIIGLQSSDYKKRLTPHQDHLNQPLQPPLSRQDAKRNSRVSSSTF